MGLPYQFELAVPQNTPYYVPENAKSPVSTFELPRLETALGIETPTGNLSMGSHSLSMPMLPGTPNVNHAAKRNASPNFMRYEPKPKTVSPNKVKPSSPTVVVPT